MSFLKYLLILIALAITSACSNSNETTPNVSSDDQDQSAALVSEVGLHEVGCTFDGPYFTLKCGPAEEKIDSYRRLYEIMRYNENVKVAEPQDKTTQLGLASRQLQVRLHIQAAEMTAIIKGSASPVDSKSSEETDELVNAKTWRVLFALLLENKIYIDFMNNDSVLSFGQDAHVEQARVTLSEFADWLQMQKSQQDSSISTSEFVFADRILAALKKL